MRCDSTLLDRGVIFLSIWCGKGVNLLVFVCISTFVSTGLALLQREVCKREQTIPADHENMRLREVLYRVACYGMVRKAKGTALKANSQLFLVSVFISGAYFSISRYGRLNCQPSRYITGQLKCQTHSTR